MKHIAHIVRNISVLLIMLALTLQSCSFVTRCPTYTSHCNAEKRTMYLKKQYKEWQKQLATIKR